ncbi:MAG: hypothetical protein IKV89_00970 [Clostridia bacterium]|nr:hypothetical protein [Clostridia bacterium]
MDNTRKIIKGISVCNPVVVERDYLMYTIDYAIEKGFDHMQVIGPIHDGKLGNIDGMTVYRKYSAFNNTKDLDFCAETKAAINEAYEKASPAGIKMYVWHHELDLPTGFNEAYPEVLNEYGDVEVTHPLVKDFLENKIIDFFNEYKMDGIILTLHETKVPLLKLKNQKLDKIGRVKYVTQILFDTCKALGKELIVRPFASIEEDYSMMMQAYEEISHDLIVMDKWTQFDWSLCLPNNKFYNKIKNNPLFVEADIFGEFFGKGRLPLMLRQHIIEKVDYCNSHNATGYCARIDRAGRHPFGDVNQVNLDIMNACLSGDDVDKAIDAFFEKKYPGAGAEVREIMEPTEDVLRRMLYLQGYYYSELSIFPGLNHSKNHFYFEMMKDDYDIASNEWFIPIGWRRGTLQSVLDEKASAKDEAAMLLDRVEALKDKIEEDEYKKLWTKFCNLKYTTAIWYELTHIFMAYTKFFETRDAKYKAVLEEKIKTICELRDKGLEILGNAFYCARGDNYVMAEHGDFVGQFTREVMESFEAELKATTEIESEAGVIDYVVCGGAMESHKLQKEVNFSDTLMIDGALCRIPGNRKGMQWSTINAHGWFSYEIKVKKGADIKVTFGSATDMLNVQVAIGDEKYVIGEPISGKREYTFKYDGDADRVRIRFDRNSKDTPCIYSIKVTE